MSWETGRSIDYYYGEYKRGGLFSKKHSIKLGIYPSEFEGEALECYGNELSNETTCFQVSFDIVIDIRITDIEKERALVIDYNPGSIVVNKISTLVFLGMEDVDRWYNLARETKKKFDEEKRKKQQF